MNQPVHMMKILLTGDGAVGKTSLITQYMHGRIRPGYKATIGVDIFKKEIVSRSGSRVILQIWDLSGQSRFGQVRKRFYAGADAVIVVFDITRDETLLNIDGWIEEININLLSTSNLPKIIAGNKIDLPEEQHIPREKIDQIISSIGYDYYRVSAVTGEEVETIFTKIADKRLESQDS